MIDWNTSPNPNARHTVLIVSQDTEMTNVWKTLFEQKNCRVMIEHTPQGAVQTARLLSPALTILELDLSQNERIELCRELRAASNGTILLLAPRVNELEISLYHQAGADEYIPTPISPMALLIKSMAWLARQEWLVPRKLATNMYV